MIVRPLLIAALLAAPLAAQTPAVGPHRPTPIPSWSAFAPPQSATVAPAVATSASIVLPGLGQLLLGQRRWTVYVGVELAGWLIHLDRLRTGRQLRRNYREVAWVAARGLAEPRTDGDWEYYERLASWSRSGDWDSDLLHDGIQPELDPGTFNGAIWALARDLYLPEGAGPEHPGYARALDYYDERATPPEFLWDWTGREEMLDLYGDLIDQSDEALRTATVVLGAVVANHLLSAVDAFVSSRLGGELPVSGGAALRTTARGTALEWRLELAR